MRDVLGRLTWQATPKNKFSAWWERTLKRRDSFGTGVDPRNAELWDTHPLHGGGTAKWTSVISSKLLFEATLGVRQVRFTAFTKPGFLKDYYTPEWYSFAAKSDTSLNKNFPSQFYLDNGCGLPQGCTAWGPANLRRADTEADRYLSALSYVTGTHNLKVGFQLSQGPVHSSNDRNGHLTQSYQNGVPSTVTVYNFPIIATPYVDGDLGVYAQDSWTIKRLTINAGLRANWFNAECEEASMGAGRFVPARYFPAKKNIPDWGPDWTPRLSAAYDLFGDGKTAIKVSYSKYMAPWTGGYASRYGEAVSLSESRAGTTADLIPGTSTRSGVGPADQRRQHRAGQRDRAQSLAGFGTRADRNPAPDLTHFYSWETTASIQHQLMTGVSVTAGCYHRIYKDMHIMDRQQITNADYTSFTTKMPTSQRPVARRGAGSERDPHDLQPEPGEVVRLQCVAGRLQQHGRVEPDGERQYGLSTTALMWHSRRSCRRPTCHSAWTRERLHPAVLRLQRRSERSDHGHPVPDRDPLDRPFLRSVELHHAVPERVQADGQLPAAVRGAVRNPSSQAYPGLERIDHVERAGQPVPGRPNQAETIVLTSRARCTIRGGTQLDINFKKNWRLENEAVQPAGGFLQRPNNNSISAMNNSIGGSLGQVTEFLHGRLPRIAFQFKW